MTAVEAVTLDIDRTLCEYRRSTAELLAEAFAEVGVDPFFTADEYRDRMFRYVPRTETKAELREACFADLAEERGHDRAVGRRVAAAHTNRRDHRAVDPVPGAREAVTALAERYPLAVVTNGAPEIQAPKLDALGLTDRFETVVHAGYDTLAKPDPAPFLDALDALGSAAPATVHVGDGRDDVLGADAAGMRAAWLRHPDERDATGRPGTRPHFELGSMRELVDPPWE
ncbi:HAD family hydrolase [Haloglomus litoreum]|uniref:HAD family hydrolase n=1 Tax=Haloglomus litoreum TaxID=3034026 RepID=UPI0023E7E9CB|nr:HAD family hydrolase [Haloglomus sp. DT116]